MQWHKEQNSSTNREHLFAAKSKVPLAWIHSTFHYQKWESGISFSFDVVRRLIPVILCKHLHSCHVITTKRSFVWCFMPAFFVHRTSVIPVLCSFLHVSTKLKVLHWTRLSNVTHFWLGAPKKQRKKKLRTKNGIGNIMEEVLKTLT